MASLFDRLVEFIAPGYVQTKVAEALPGSASVDADDDEYRRLTGTARDINPVQHERAQTISVYLWRQNPMAHRLTEMIADFVVGDGVTVEAEDEQVQEVIDEFWKDPKTNLELNHRNLVRDQSIYGELAFRVAVAKEGGRVRLGFIDPSRIKQVRLDPDNAMLDKTLVLKPPTGSSEEIPLEIVWTDDETDPTNPTVQGEAFYFGINRITGQSRGTPDLLAVADFVDGYDQLLFNSLERSGLVNAFVWDVTLSGSTDAQVKDWASKHGAAPPPGTVRVHNDKEIWAAVTPSLGSADITMLGRSIKNMALGGLGTPEAWFAEGDSANRATLAEQSDPTYRMLVSRQKQVQAMFAAILDFVVAKAIESGRLSKTVDRTIQVNMPDPSSKDISKTAGALAQLANALGLAQDAAWIDTENARKVFLLITSGFGIDLDPTLIGEAADAEKEAADAEAQKQMQAQQQAMVATAQAKPADNAPPGNGQKPAVPVG